VLCAVRERIGDDRNVPESCAHSRQTFRSLAESMRPVSFQQELLKGKATRHNDSLSQGFGVGNKALSGSGDARKSRNNWPRLNTYDADTRAIAYAYALFYLCLAVATSE
jgi:hypothetical protein